MLLGIEWYHFISNDEVRRQTNQPLLMEIIQVWRLAIFGRIARMDDNVDAKQILNSSLSVYWKRPPGRPRMTWMKTVQNDLDSHELSWTEAVDLAQNQPLWRLLATSGATHSWCKPEMMIMMAVTLIFPHSIELQNSNGKRALTRVVNFLPKNA